MNRKFEVLFLEEAREFLGGLEKKARTKILYNIEKSKILNDCRLFKKLSEEVWEFRTEYNGLQYRLLAFWDKTDKVEALVISTHGFVKKTDKVSLTAIDKAENLRRSYFDQKDKK